MSAAAAAPRPDVPSAAAADLVRRYQRIRGRTEALCRPLCVEDYGVQSMPDVSPTKWHLAHVTWFFESFILCRDDGYQPFHPQFEYLFNSYYNSVGQQYPRSRRGLVTRPTVAEVMDHRGHVDAAMASRLTQGDFDAATRDLIELGLNHEQQHQELLLMDIKHVLFQNPLFPAYDPHIVLASGTATPQGWIELPAGDYSIGAGGDGFHYDNEAPRHTVRLDGCRLADRPVSNGEMLEFVQDGGYRQSLLWLSDGWSRVEQEGWQAPLYWVQRDGQWWEYTLAGLVPLDRAAPVCHVSYYEADAYASWRQARLPTEAEWEVAAGGATVGGHFVEAGRLHPAARGDAADTQLFGDVWEWTRSAYHPYPGFRAAAGAVGEYNGKFMCNQLVMRGGACVTPRDHIRASYRNFFYPHMRWQFGGIRLAS